MLTQLSTVKSRLAILESDTQYDSLLTTAIKAVSARFDRETHRTLARQVDATQEFAPDETEIIATRYPIESVTKFETKTDEAAGARNMNPSSVRRYVKSPTHTWLGAVSSSPWMRLVNTGRQ